MNDLTEKVRVDNVILEVNKIIQANRMIVLMVEVAIDDYGMSPADTRNALKEEFPADILDRYFSIFESIRAISQKQKPEIRRKVSQVFTKMGMVPYVLRYNFQ